MAEDGLFDSNHKGWSYFDTTADLHSTADGTTPAYRSIREENAKLRELVRLMYERDERAKLCYACNPHDCALYGSDLCGRIGELTEWLGIEVDE